MDYESIDKIIKIYNETIDIFDDILVGQLMAKKVLASSLLCDSNSKILLTGKVGMGKTEITSYLAKCFESLRISITEDLMPSEVLEQIKNHPEIRLLQLEEFNRARAKVQASFNELFAEQQVTINGKKYPYKDLYVIATQNDSDIAGLFNVSQAVYDRFDVRISFDSLDEEEMRDILFKPRPQNIKPLNKEDLILARNILMNFSLKESDEDLFIKAFKIINDLKYNKEDLFFGSNIRAHKFVINLAKLNALIDGRDYILPRDIALFLDYVYSHRIDETVINPHSLDAKNLFANTRDEILSLKRKRK